MVEPCHPTSLLPYLHPPRGACRLTIRLAEGGRPPEGAHPASPFLVVGEETSATRLVAAVLATDAGSTVKELFVLQQSDRYPQAAGGSWALTNAEIEARWQSAYRSFAAAESPSAASGAPLLLQGQIGPEGRLLPFDALFYCRFTARYFHPPCPGCGRPLGLCREEALLAKAGLGSYSGSPQRYLYCPACAAGRPDPLFYARERAPGHPDCVADLPALVQGFADLAALSPTSSRDLPCIGCAEAAACYGRHPLAAERITPFSFFPFHALLFEAGELAAADFLDLLGGATPEELAERAERALQPGRRRTLGAFRRRRPEGLGRFCSAEATPTARFLETLYLKLSFLAELADSLLDRSRPADDGGAFSLDRIWVALPDAAGRLPTAWDFTVRHYGIGLEDAASAGLLPDHAPSSRLYFFGLAWFWALLANRDQGMEAVRPALERLIRGGCCGVSEFRDAPFEDIDPVFRPQNLFFRPGPAPLDDSALALWQGALELGSAVLVACLDPQPSRAAEAFGERLERLRSDVARALFAAIAPLPAAASSDERRIAAVLSRLSRKWRAAAAAAAPPATPAVGPRRAPTPDPVEELEETLLMRPAGDRRSTPPAAPGSTAPAHGETEEALEETVCLRPAPARGTPSTASPPTEEMPETLILPASAGGRRPPASPTPSADARTREASRKAPQKDSAAQAAAPDDLAETVVIRTAKRKPIDAP